MNPIKLSHQSILRGTKSAHLARATLLPGTPKAHHQQDFAEVFWVQNGRVRHHIGASHIDLTEGDLVFVAPGQAHALQGRGPEALVVSVTLHPDIIADLGQRHPALNGHLFWSSGLTSTVHPRDSRQLADLNHAALTLEQSDCGRLDAEAFLLPLCALLLRTVTAAPDTAPDWLVRACVAARSPAVFVDGSAGFVRAAGKAHAHVSRVARTHLGQSPSEYVNAIRMEWAARQLAGSNDPLAEIAAECGLPNMSHFHRLFLAQHGMTPHQYRKSLQRNIIQPEN